MMHTVALDIVDDQALDLLQVLEGQQLICLHKDSIPSYLAPIDWAGKYKGAMARQPLPAINQQLYDLRQAWE